jgi:hypothetical protein
MEAIFYSIDGRYWERRIGKIRCNLGELLEDQE